MAARFNRQGHLGAMLSLVHPSLEYKPSTRVEGACGSGGLALTTAIKSVLADQPDVVLSLGVEVQNTVKAIYGADILAGAGHYAGERKNGHAYFFPAKFSRPRRRLQGEVRRGEDLGRHGPLVRAGGRERAPEPEGPGVPQHGRGPLRRHQAMKPNPKDLLRPHQRPRLLQGLGRRRGRPRRLEEGLKKIGKTKADAVELVGLGHAVADLTAAPRT